MRFGRSVVAGIVAIGVVAFAGKTADAGNVHNEGSPPTTDFHTVVTEPGRGGGRSGSDHPAPVCVWVPGGTTEIDALARNSGPAAPIIRESADDNILLVYRC